MRPTQELLGLDLEHLIRAKPFEALSLEERAAVLTEVERTEYERLRETALLAQRYLSEPLAPPRPRPGTQAVLQSRLRRRQAWLTRLGRALDYRLPVWQAAAAAVVLVLAVQLAGRPPFSAASAGSSSSYLADSTHHDSALQRVADPHEDSVFSRLQRESDTL